MKVRQRYGDAEAQRLLDSIDHTSPYPPEPPQRSWVVDGLMAIAGDRSQTSPHSCGGNDADKIQYEWDAESRRGFWDLIGEHGSIEMMDDKDVLDVGCGWGGKDIYYATTTRLRSIVGVDIPGVFKPDVATEFAQTVGASKASFLTGFAENLPVPEESFDLVIMEDVLEHVRDPEAVLGECLRVLRPGGKCVARFPSIRMVYAHHFDRALSLPGLHYLMSMRTWSAGFNYYLATHRDTTHYVPFAKVVPKKFHKSIGMDLSGLTLGSFRKMVRDSPFVVESLAVLGFCPTRVTAARKLILPVYRTLRKLPFFHEALGFTIVFVGRKPGQPDDKGSLH